MTPFRYTVAVSLPDEETAERWLRWLRDGHVAEVLAGGATAAEIVRCDAPAIEFEVRYDFPSRDSFDRYERELAPRLRFVERVESEADVNDHVLPGLHPRHVLHTNALEDAAEIDLAHEHVMLAIGFDNSSGNAETHRGSPIASSEADA